MAVDYECHIITLLQNFLFIELKPFWIIYVVLQTWYLNWYFLVNKFTRWHAYALMQVKIWENMCRSKPDPLDRDKERQLQKVATRYIVLSAYFQFCKIDGSAFSKCSASLWVVIFFMLKLNFTLNFRCELFSFTNS